MWYFEIILSDLFSKALGADKTVCSDSKNSMFGNTFIMEMNTLGTLTALQERPIRNYTKNEHVLDVAIWSYFYEYLLKISKYDRYDK